MDHLQKSRMKVVKYIKAGKISKESGELALEHVKKFALEGKMADIDIILEKMGALKVTPKKKLLNVDDADNPYLQKRKTGSKTPLIIAMVIFVVSLVVLILAFTSSSNKKREHAEKNRIRKEAAERKSSGKSASDTSKALDILDLPDPDKDKKEEPKKEESKKEEPKKEEVKKEEPKKEEADKKTP